MERFSYEWTNFNKIIPDYEGQFLKWIYPLLPKDFKNKKILDAGCGMGRNSFWPLLYEAKEVIAFDHDQQIIKVTKKNLSKFKNAKVFLGSIYDIKYKDYFDIAFSIGVIHHLKYPQKAVNNLISSVRKNGLILIWVYGKEDNRVTVKVINSLRYFTSKAPFWLVNVFSHFLTVIFWFYLKLFNPTHPYLKQLSNFKFWHLKLIIFDQLIPPIANYWTRQEALSLLNDSRLKNIKIYRVNHNSWALIAHKK